MSEECAKGTLILGAAVAVRRHRDAGRVSAAELAEALSPEAIAILDERIDISRWYPIRVLCELIELDWRVAGHNDPGYLERQGALTADRLFDSRLYQQLDYAERSGRVDSRRSLERQSRLITTITGTLYDFLTFEVKLSGDSLEIEYGQARSFSDALVHTTVGFMSQINERQGSKRRWTGRRVAPDRVAFRLELPDRFAS